MLQLSFDFLSENSKKVVGDCRIFISAKLRISLKHVSIKVMIPGLTNPSEFGMKKKYGKIKVCWQCAHELRVAPAGRIGAFSCLQVNAGRQKVCCYFSCSH